MFVYKDITKCHSFGEGVLKKFFYGVKMPFFARGGQKNLQISSLSKKIGIALMNLWEAISIQVAEDRLGMINLTKVP